MAIVGPGTQVQDIAAPEPTLSGASEYEYVTILNPLSDDFQVQVAQDIPVNIPFEIRGKTDFTQSERDVAVQYGVTLKNKEHIAKKYIYNQTIIPAGGTMNFKGNEAQVVVKQLVDTILQLEGKARLMADPNLRKEIEDRIIQRRGSVQEILDRQFVTPRQQLDNAINQSNEVNNETTAFAGLKEAGSPAPGVGDSPVPDPGSKPGVAEPKKANSK